MVLSKKLCNIDLVFCSEVLDVRMKRCEKIEGDFLINTYR